MKITIGLLLLSGFIVVIKRFYNNYKFCKELREAMDFFKRDLYSDLYFNSCVFEEND